MAVSSVSSSISANTQTVRPQTQQPDQAPQAKKPDEERTKAQAKPQTEAPKPVVNTQGQTTGKIINVMA